MVSLGTSQTFRVVLLSSSMSDWTRKHGSMANLLHCQPRSIRFRDYFEEDIDEDYDPEWEEFVLQLKHDLRIKLYDLSYFLGKTMVGPKILLAVLTILGLSFHTTFPYKVKITPEPNGTIMRWVLSFLVDKYDI
ncbi:hypothetical protein AAMO2058_000144700 [Amorphochlora amoebiformis]